MQIYENSFDSYNLEWQKKKKTAYFAACRRQRAWRLGSASLCQQFPRRGRRHKRRLCIFHRQRWLNVSAVQP